MNLEEILEFRNFSKRGRGSEFNDFKENYEKMLTSNLYEKKFFEMYLEKSCYINQFLKLSHEYGIGEKLKNYILEYSEELEMLISYYLYLYVIKDSFKEEVKDFIINRLTLGEKISSYYRLEFYLFCIFTETNMLEYENLLKDRNYSSYNEVNLLNESPSTLFTSSSEINDYNKDKTLLNISTNELFKAQSKNEELFVLNTLIYIQGGWSSSSDVLLSENKNFINNLMNFKDMNLNDLFKNFSLSEIIYFYKSGEKKLRNKDRYEEYFSLEYNNVLSSEEKISFLDKILGNVVENDFVEHQLDKLYSDIIYVNGLLNYELPDKNKYPNISNTFKYLFFKNMDKSHLSYVENKVMFKNTIHLKDNRWDRNDDIFPKYFSSHYYKRNGKKNEFILKEKITHSKDEMLFKNLLKEGTLPDSLKEELAEQYPEPKKEEYLESYIDVVNFKLDLNSLKELKEYSENTPLYFEYLELLNNLDIQSFYNNLIDKPKLLSYLGLVIEIRYKEIHYNYIDKFNNIPNLVNYLFRDLVKDKEKNNSHIIKMLKYHLRLILDDNKNEKELLSNKDFYLSLNISSYKILDFYKSKKVLNEKEKIRFEEKSIEKFINEDISTYKDIKDIEGELEKLEPLKEFKLRLKYYLDDKKKKLYKNTRIFDLLKNHYVEILSNKYIVEKLVEKSSWSSEVDKTIFITDLINYEETMTTWNIIRELSVEYQIKIDEKLKTEFFYTDIETLEDVF